MAICCDAELLAEELADTVNGDHVGDVEHTTEGHAFTVRREGKNLRVLVTSDFRRVDTKDDD